MVVVVDWAEALHSIRYYVVCNRQMVALQGLTGIKKVVYALGTSSTEKSFRTYDVNSTLKWKWWWREYVAVVGVQREAPKKLKKKKRTMNKQGCRMAPG